MIQSSNFHNINQQRSSVDHYKAREEQEVHLNALKSEFDSMEESLRNALRHKSQQNFLKPSVNKNPSMIDNTITKRRNYITVYEHEPAQDPSFFQKPQNLKENRGTVNAFPNQVASQTTATLLDKDAGNIPVMEFQRYCSLLMERIRKMEEQNVELAKLAQQQKLEYDKVIAQVAESEKSQKLLLSECSSLRKQVQQLANHNKELKEQNIATSAPTKNVLDTPFKPSQNCRMDEPFTSRSIKQQEDLQQLHGHNVPLRYNKTDVASIVELYAALQKATLADFDSPSSEMNRDQSVRSSGLVRSSAGHVDEENSDYASPSSICAAASCTRCLVRSNSDSNVFRNQLPNHQQHNHVPSSNKLNRSYRSECTSLDRGKPEPQSFDNNSYVEVELKPGKIFQHSRKTFQLGNVSNPDDQCNFGKETSASINNNTNNESFCGLSRRPSNFKHNKAFTEVFFAGTYQPPSNSNTSFSPIAPQSVYSDSITKDEQSSQSATEVEKKPLKNHRQFTRRDQTGVSSSFSMPESGNPPRDVSGVRSSQKMKKYTRSSSTSDLPPPPPPPPMTPEMKKDLVFIPKALSDSSPHIVHKNLSEDRNLALSGLKPIRESNASEEEEDSQVSSNETDSASSGWRRGSYSRACRRSRSFDHLHEGFLDDRNKQHPKQNEVEKQNSKLGQSSIFSFPTQISQKNVTTSRARAAPSPTFVIQESSASQSPYEIMMLASKAKQHAEKKEKIKDKEKDCSSPLSPSVHSRLQKISVMNQQLRKQSSIEDDTDLKNAFSLSEQSVADDVVFLANKEKLHNRRSSEGSATSKQKNKFFDDDERNQIIRQRSFGENYSKDNCKAPQGKSTTQLLPNKTYMSTGKELHKRFQQPRFPATNPHFKPVLPSSNINTKIQKSKNSPNVSSKSKLVTFEDRSICKNNHIRKNEESIVRERQNSKSFEEQNSSNASQKLTHVTLDETSLHNLNNDKNAKQRKENISEVNDIRKKSSSGNGPSKSFVSLMKAKFSRSSTKSSSQEKNHPKALGSFPVTPSSSLIDPRTLSLEPNSYVMYNRDGRRNSKQMILGQNSDAAVGRKLSQPFPNGFGEDLRQNVKLNKLSEETLSDEGFAESSSLERRDNNLAHSLVQNSHSQDKNPVSNYTNVEFSTNVIKRQCSEGSSGAMKQFPRHNSHSYENNNMKTPSAYVPTFSTPAGFYVNSKRQQRVRNLYENFNPLQPVSPKNQTSQFNAHSQLSVKMDKVQNFQEKMKPQTNKASDFPGKQHLNHSNISHEHQFEKNFINSHVQAELNQRFKEKNIETDLNKNIPGSSVDSLPSDVVESRSDLSNSNSNEESAETTAGSLEKSIRKVLDLKTEKISSSFFGKTSTSYIKGDSYTRSKLPSCRNKQPAGFKNEKSPKTSEYVIPAYNSASLAVIKKTNTETVDRDLKKLHNSPTKKMQVSYRPTKIANVSNLAPPGPLLEGRSGSTDEKAHDDFFGNNQARMKAKPFLSTSLNASVSTHGKAANKSLSPREPLYENASIIAYHERK